MIVLFGRFTPAGPGVWTSKVYESFRLPRITKWHRIEGSGSTSIAGFGNARLTVKLEGSRLRAEVRSVSAPRNVVAHLAHCGLYLWRVDSANVSSLEAESAA